jgi:hypothetical protein
MFEFLNDTTVQDAVPAGHHAIQIVRQWAAATMRSGIRGSMTEDLTPSQATLVMRIVQEIEAHEGKAITELSEAKINEYISAVADRIEDLSRRQLGVDRSKGRTLLERLRSGTR